MISSSALVVALSLGGAVMPIADSDIPYFKANPAARAETLRRCHADYALADTRECRNAEAAGTMSLGKPMPPPGPETPLLNPVPKHAPQTDKRRDRGT
jgi:hypothetical protein